MPGLLELIDAPVALPSQFGLLESLGATPGEGHWQQGVLYQAYCPTGGSTWEECLAVTGVGPPPPPPTKTATGGLDLRLATPVIVYAMFQCSAVGLPDVEDLAGQALTRVEGWQLERSFWTGLAGPAGAQQPTTFPHLAANAGLTFATGPFPGQLATLQTAATVVTGAASGDPAAALGALEQALADCYKGQGVIHVPIAALSTLASAALIDRRGARLETFAGNQVVAGGGYPGTSPAGAAPATGTSWLYATGRPFIYRGPPRASAVRDSLNRAENTVQMLAERAFLVGWDCCHFAVPLTLGAF